MSKGSTWHHRKASSDEERFGLLDSPKMVKYKKQPVLQEPLGASKPGPERLTAMGVTSGVGSMLVGAQQLGFEVLGNVEWRDYYRYKALSTGGSTFPQYFPKAFNARGLRDVPKDWIPTSLDLVAGHPECGRYSQLSHSVTQGNYGQGRGGDVSDIPLFLKIVQELRPKYFLMDDLPDSLEVFPIRKYVELLPDYDLFPEWVSNWGYGNVQKHRNRMFMIGALKTEKFVFRANEAPHDIVLSDMIEDLLGVKAGDAPNHAFVDPSKTPARYCHMRFYGDRQNWGDLQTFLTEAPLEDTKNLIYHSPEGVRKSRPGTNNPKWEGSCPVLSGGYNPIHPIRKSPLSLRERARIQGFPDDFIFHSDEHGVYHPVWEPYNSDGQRGIKQTGKSMPIQFCRYFADQVKHNIQGVPFQASGVRLLKPNKPISKAKEDFCTLVGYADQEAACNACWLKETCTIRRDKWGLV